jgi:hypothetical protein
MARKKTGAPPAPVEAPKPTITPVENSVVATIPHRKSNTLQIGRPDPLATARMRRVANAFAGAYPQVGGTDMAGAGPYYSPEYSTDYLQLPHSQVQQWHWYRFFYKTDPFVKRAIDVHTELPLSKVRLSVPRAKNKELAQRAYRYCQKWADRTNLLHRLIEITFELNLLGEVNVYMEDNSPDMPRDIREENTLYFDSQTGQVREQWQLRDDADDREAEWVRKNYRGWTGIRVIPPEQVQVVTYPLSEDKDFELIPDRELKTLISRADAGDPTAIRVIQKMSEDLISAIRQDQNVPLNTDPDLGSHIVQLTNKKSQYDPRGHSLLECCIRTLVHRDKLRQAQAQISSRHMTPIRVVWGENLDAGDVEALRDQISMALIDPDYSIIVNKQITWEEMGSESRLLDLGSEYDLSDRQLYAGLGVTESLLSGESSYSGDRINLEVINTRYLLLRELLQDFVERHMFQPMCRRMGFVETDQDGDEVVIYPKLSFTRLALRDNADTFDALFNLYNKNSLGLSVILDLLNIDFDATQEEVQKSLFTVNDPLFNELIRSLYGAMSDEIKNGTDVIKRAAEAMGLKYEKPAEEGRF